MSEKAPHSAWLTNTLLSAVIALLMGAAAVGKTAYDNLNSTVARLVEQNARIEAQLKVLADWREHHVGRPHAQAAAQLQAEAEARHSLAARVGALELATKRKRG